MTQVEKLKLWHETEEGVAFRKRQSERLTKYSSVKERDYLRNERRKAKRKINIKSNLQYKLAGCKQRAKKDNLPFDLDIDYLLSIYVDTCPYLNIKLNLIASSGNSMDGVSIDKIIPELGYVKGNIQIISYKANVMKQDVSLDCLRTFAKNILKIHGN